MSKHNTLNVRYEGSENEVEIHDDGGMIVVSNESKNGARTHEIVVRGGPYAFSSLFALGLKVLAGSCQVKEDGSRAKRLGEGDSTKMEPGSSFTLKAKLAVVEVKTKPGPGLGGGRWNRDKDL